MCEAHNSLQMGGGKSKLTKGDCVTVTSGNDEGRFGEITSDDNNSSEPFHVTFSDLGGGASNWLSEACVCKISREELEGGAWKLDIPLEAARGKALARNGAQTAAEALQSWLSEMVKQG